MKNGEKLIFFVLCVTVGFLWESNKSMRKYFDDQEDPTINQYLNRLKEFFDSDVLEKVKNEFIDLVECGINPASAFEMLVFRGELN